MAINESGLVCGYSMNSAVGPLTAVVWTETEIVPLNVTMGPNSKAWDVADDGTVCGWMGDAPYWITSHAFLWKDGVTTDLGTVLPDADTAVARGLNNIGSVCGFSIYQPTSQNPLRKAFLWQNGQAQYLGILSPFPSSFAIDVNDSNIVVGYCYGIPNNELYTAFVWQNGTMYALSDLVPPELGLVIWIAEAINNAGQIAAYGLLPPNQGSKVYVAMRLNPNPPLTGDITCDWKVNVPDLLAVLNAWGPCAPPPPNEPFTKNCHADLNGDNTVSLDDLLTVVLNWAP